jgi:hypothetical protein
MKKNILFIYRGQVLLKEFLPEYNKFSGENCVLLVEKGIPFNIVYMDIKKMGLNVNLMTHDDLLGNKIKMKFDSIVMNPPYKSGLHIDLFNKAFDLLKSEGSMTCIHPSTPFITRKPTKIDSKTKKIREIISTYKTEIKLVDGNKLFNAGFFAPLSITHVQKIISETINVTYQHINEDSCEVHTYETINDIFIHGNNIVTSIYKKVCKKMKLSVDSKLTRKGSRGNFYLKLNSIVGNIPKNGKLNPDFNCLIYRENQNSFNELFSNNFINGDTMYVSLDSEQEGINFFNYCLTKFARFCVSFYKINQHIDRGELLALPFLDFTREWTDSMLFEYFEFSDDEVDFINNYIGDWYERDIN